MGLFFDCKLLLIFKDKWKAIIKFSVIFLLEIKDTLLGMDMDNISDFFRENKKNLHNDTKYMIRLYNRLKVKKNIYLCN